MMSAFNCWFFEDDMRDENEKRILKTIRQDDVEELKAILTAPAGCRLGSDDTPILSVAVMKGDCAMIKHLIDNCCDPREIDKNGRSVWYVLLFCWPRGSSDDEKRRLDIADILLTSYSNPMETVFLNANENEMTPFLSACYYGCDAIILRFLELLDTNSISMDHVIDNHGDNLFHHLLNSCRFCIPAARVETARALIEKFPYSDQLTDATNQNGETPLHKLLVHSGRGVIDLANLFLQHGASPDTQDRDGRTYLERVIWSGDASIVETLLRAGCRTYIFKDESPLSRLLKDRLLFSCSETIRVVIELLLAFGYDLQKELFLYTVDERPIEFTSPEYARVRDTSRMNPVVLKALRELRRSNKMLSLQRQCRNTIRRHLKVKADEVIGKLTCIPDRIKSFLLVQNEEPLLKI